MVVDILNNKKQLIDYGVVYKTILFTSKELEKATNHFNENRILWTRMTANANIHG